MDAIFENDPTTKNNRRILGRISPEKEFLNKIHFLQSCGFSSVAVSKAYGVTVLPSYWEKGNE